MEKRILTTQNTRDSLFNGHPGWTTRNVQAQIHVEMSSKDVLFLPGILEAVSARLGEAEKTARSTIEMYRRDLTLIADALQESGYLSGSEIEELLRSPDVDPSAMIGAVPIQT